MSNYSEDAYGDAQDCAREYLDSIIEQLIDDGEASDDLLNDYGNGDAYHHESHVDKSYDLQEAAALLDELDEYEETDDGPWEGCKPREAISAQAAHTYGNAVYSKWQTIIEGINDDDDIQVCLESYSNVDDTIAEELEAHREKAEESESFDEDTYAAPFDEDDEADNRREALKVTLRKLVSECIDGTR